MKATIKFTNYSKNISKTKSFSIPSKVTEKTILRFEKIEESIMNDLNVDEYEDFGCEILYKCKCFNDMQELIDYLVD